MNVSARSVVARPSRQAGVAGSRGEHMMMKYVLLAAARATAAATVGAGLLLLSPGPALAGGNHGGPEPMANSSRPLPNTTVSTELDRVTVGFNAPLAELSGHVLTVTDPEGERVDAGRVSRLDAQTLGVELQPLSRTGTYTVTYTGLTQGHSPSGTFTFAYTGPTASTDGSTVPMQAALAGGGVLVLAGLGAALCVRLM